MPATLVHLGNCSCVALPPYVHVGRLYSAHGPIEIIVTQINGGQVKLGIIAHPDLKILRDAVEYLQRRVGRRNLSLEYKG